MDASEKLQVLYERKVRECTKCGLSESRQNTVFGEGESTAKVMVIGEGPGQQEDESGRPFVGKCGPLVTNMLAAMGLQRADVFVTNVVKCRPPGNRQPTYGEARSCMPYLEMQLKIVNPRYVICLGKTACHYVLKFDGKPDDHTMTEYRGKLFEIDGRFIVGTYHPSYILRNESTDAIKAEVWKDLVLLRNRMIEDSEPATAA